MRRLGRRQALSLAATVAWGATSVAAQSNSPQAGLTALGYTGLGLTPSATPAAWGQVLAAHDTALPGLGQASKGHSFGLAVGLLPGLEVSGRLATHDLHCNLYHLGPNPCAGPVQRDLSASFKLGHRLVWQALPGLGLSAAVGANDLGGAATHHRSYYGVLGIDQGPWALQAGWARAVSASATLNGAFGSLAWRASGWLQLQGERIGARSWLGARLTLPAAWQPQAVQPWLLLQHSLQDDRFTPRQWLSFGVSIQLGRPAAAGPATAQASLHASQNTRRPTWVDAGDAPPAPGSAGAVPTLAVAALTGGPATAHSTATAAAPATAPAAAPADTAAAQHAATTAHAANSAANSGADWARRLAARLAKAGFEDISVGHQPATGRLRVDAENSGYAWNDLDALGVAMGLVASTPADPGATLVLRLRKRNLVVWQVTGSAACIAQWLRGQAAHCPDGQPLRLQAGALAQDRPGAGDDSAITWWVQRERSSWLRPRLLLAPDIDSRVGTEYGSFDSTWGLGLALQLPLWPGAHADFAHVQALGHSADYNAGQVFSDFRIDSQSYRLMLHQALGLGPGLDARLAAGRLFKKLDGGTAEIRWQPGQGYHRLGLELSHYSHVDVDFKKRSAMASYRYFLAPLQTSLELHGGRFWHGDRGAMATSRHWFGDVSVALYLRRSRFPEGSPALYSPYGNSPVNAAGIEFSFPLTPRREHVGSLLQLRGTDRFSYGVQSVVGQKTSNNLTPWFGRFAPVPMGLAATVDNFDRASQAYLDSNLHRLREAWASLPAE